MKLFLQKHAKFSSAGDSASSGWGLRPQTPSLWQLEVLPPDPNWLPAAKQPPPLRISGYAPETNQY